MRSERIVVVAHKKVHLPVVTKFVDREWHLKNYGGAKRVCSSNRETLYFVPESKCREFFGSRPLKPGAFYSSLVHLKIAAGIDLFRYVFASIHQDRARRDYEGTLLESDEEAATILKRRRGACTRYFYDMLFSLPGAVHWRNVSIEWRELFRIKELAGDTYDEVSGRFIEGYASARQEQRADQDRRKRGAWGSSSGGGGEDSPRGGASEEEEEKGFMTNMVYPASEYMLWTSACVDDIAYSDESENARRVHIIRRSDLTSLCGTYAIMTEEIGSLQRFDINNRLTGWTAIIPATSLVTSVRRSGTLSKKGSANVTFLTPCEKCLKEAGGRVVLVERHPI